MLKVRLLLSSAAFAGLASSSASAVPGHPASASLQDCAAFVDDYVYQSAPASPLLTSRSSPLADKYSALLEATCAKALSGSPVLPTADAAAFTNAYTAFNGTNSEADVIERAGALLSREDVKAFFALPDSLDQGGLDADLILCAVLVEATPAGLANFTGQGKAQEETVDSLLANTPLMRDMLVAGGAAHGMYGEAATIYAKITASSTVLSSASAASNTAPASPWDDRTQTKEAVLHRTAVATAVEHAVPVNHRFTQSYTPPWGPASDPADTVVDPVARFMHYESAFLAGDLDPAFEVLTAFEMRQTVNADAVDVDLAWMRETMGIYTPDAIAMNYSEGSEWRYAETVHHEVAYVHTHCPQPNYTAVCDGHYSMIPAKGGICGFRAFWGRISRKAFGIPTWGAKHTGHAAMTSWNPQGWVIMLAGADWGQGSGFDTPVQSGLDFHLDAQARELRPTYQNFLRGSWVARARNETLVDRGWDCNYAGHGACSKFGVGGLWNSLMLYQKKATVGAATTSGTVPIPTRPIGPSAVPTKVDALLAKWNTAVPPPKVTTAADGTITIPAAAFSAGALTTAKVAIMKSYTEDSTQIMHYGGNAYDPSVADLVYQFTAETAGTYYLTANHSTWHTEQDLMLAVNGKKAGNVPVYLTLGYWNETQPVEVVLAEGTNTLTFTRLSTTPTTFKDFTLYRTKPVVPAPPGGGYTPQPITPPLPASAFLLEPPTTSCILQGIKNVPEDLCTQACLLVANRTNTGTRPNFPNVKGCFAIMTGQYKGNCNYNGNASTVCTPPCGSPGDEYGELCLTNA